VAFLQNHDQIGNRATGERISHMVGPGRARMGAALYLCAPWVPLLFQGEEWAASSPFQYFTDHGGELGRLVTEGRRREFAAFDWSPDDVPDPEDPATFERSILRWDEAATGEHRDMLDWYRALLEVRRRNRPGPHRAFADGNVVVLENGDVTVTADFASGAVTVDHPGGRLQGDPD
jgi:maltooligosyltrehalose trehalohydrolase